jgi:hypothetical protein
VLLGTHDRINRFIGGCELTQTSNESDQFTRLQEDETSRAMVIGQSTEGFVTK